MTLRPFVLALLLAATAAQGQRVSPQVQQRLALLGAALGQCHRAAAVRLARAPLTPEQAAERALAQCAARETPIRQTLARAAGAANARRILAAQRVHWRRTIVAIIQQARVTMR